MSLEVFDFPDDDYFIMEYPLLDIHTIALVLGRICRFAGNCKPYWPVLMHSLVVAYLVSGTVVVHALLHDAAEIYIGDIPSPVKSPLQRDFEDSALRHIYRCLGLPFPSPEIRRIVKEADVRSCIAEVWTVGPERLRILPGFQKRDRFAERMITQMLDIYDYNCVLDADGKYVNLFIDMFYRLKP